MLAGAASSRLHPIDWARAQITRQLSLRQSDPEAISRPFDLDRDGEVPRRRSRCVRARKSSFCRSSRRQDPGPRRFLGLELRGAFEWTSPRRQRPGAGDPRGTGLRAAHGGRHRPCQCAWLEYSTRRSARSPSLGRDVARRAGHGAQELFRQPGSWQRRRRNGRPACCRLRPAGYRRR